MMRRLGRAAAGRLRGPAAHGSTKDVIGPLLEPPQLQQQQSQQQLEMQHAPRRLPLVSRSPTPATAAAVADSGVHEEGGLAANTTRHNLHHSLNRLEGLSGLERLKELEGTLERRTFFTTLPGVEPPGNWRLSSLSPAAADPLRAMDSWADNKTNTIRKANAATCCDGLLVWQRERLIRRSFTTTSPSRKIHKAMAEEVAGERYLTRVVTGEGGREHSFFSDLTYSTINTAASEHASANASTNASQDQANIGGDTAPEPMDYAIASVALCTTMTIRLYAERKQWPLDRIRVDAVEERTRGAGHVPDGIRLTLHLDGQHLTSEQRQRLLDVSGKCPVKLMMLGKMPKGITTFLAPLEEGK